jgi:hypothetical protein
MICFEARLNGRKLATAGIPGDGVLAATLTWVKRRGKRLPDDGRVEFRLGGLGSGRAEWEPGTQIPWSSERLEPGDALELRVIRSDRADPPRAQSPAKTREEAPGDAAASERHHLALYRKWRRRLERNIRALERSVERRRRKRRR